MLMSGGKRDFHIYLACGNHRGHQLHFGSLSLCALCQRCAELCKADPNNGVVRFINAICEPPCRYLLRKFPKLMLQSSGGYIDLSPLALMLGIGCVRILLEYIHNYFRYGGAGV